MEFEILSNIRDSWPFSKVLHECRDHHKIRIILVFPKMTNWQFLKNLEIFLCYVIVWLIFNDEKTTVKSFVPSSTFSGSGISPYIFSLFTFLTLHSIHSIRFFCFLFNFQSLMNDNILLMLLSVFPDHPLKRISHVKQTEILIALFWKILGGTSAI